VQRQRRVGERADDVDHVLRVPEEVAFEDGAVNHLQVCVPGHGHGDGREPPLEALADLERPGGGVHGGHELTVDDLFAEAQVEAVEDGAVLGDLRHERDGVLRAVLLDVRQVDVVDEVHHVLAGRRAVPLPGTLVDGRLDLRLKFEGVGVVRQRRVVEHETVVVLVQALQVLGQDGRLARPGQAHEHGVLVLAYEKVYDGCGPDRVDRRHVELPERHVRHALADGHGGVLGDGLDPVLEGLALDVVKVIEALAVLERPQVADEGREGLAERRPAVLLLVDDHRAAEGPHDRVQEEPLDDLFGALGGFEVVHERFDEIHRHGHFGNKVNGHSLLVTLSDHLLQERDVPARLRGVS